jgi:hypothetical protein
MRSQLLAARAAALFASELPSGTRPAGAVVEAAIGRAVRTFGVRGCVATLAAAYGECPETAMPRMRWARGVVLSLYDVRRPEPERELAAA